MVQTFWLLALMAISASTLGDEGSIVDCSSIEVDSERLICYDERARDERRQQERQAAEVIGPAPARAAQAPVQSEKPAAVADPRIVPKEAEPAVADVEPQVTDVGPPVVEVEPAVAEAEPAVAETEPSPDDFGRPKTIPRSAKFASRIESIRTSPRGHHVMTLGNGQIWAENEPGVWRIKPGQDVTIIKARFHFDMRLESGRRVAVHRIDND